jgi:outer membrane protein
MKYWKVLILVFGLFSTLSAVAQELRLAYINGVRIENDTKRAYDVAESLRLEFSSREQEVHKLESRAKALQAELAAAKTPSERDNKQHELQISGQRYEQVARAFVDDLERRKADERRKYFLEVTQVVRKIAESQKYDLVVQDAVYATKAVDLTEAVIKAMGGPAPKAKP